MQKHHLSVTKAAHETHKASIHVMYFVMLGFSESQLTQDIEMLLRPRRNHLLRL